MSSIREELPEDREAIREVHIRAFGQPQEADLVDELRNNCDDLLSLVAVTQGRIVGHILFSPAVIVSGGRRVQGMGLAPMGVVPERQRRGIGTALVRAGIAKLKKRRCPFIIVLGHPAYYPRFGFEPAQRYGIRSEWEVPDEAFMLLALERSQLRGISGVATYRPEFARAGNRNGMEI